MKIGILTQPLRNNYGGLLQNYALQQVLIRAGYDPCTIDQSRTIKTCRLRRMYMRAKAHVKHLLFPHKYKRPAYVVNEYEEAIISKNTNYFIDKYINRTKTIDTHQKFLNIANSNEYQAYIVGSDQCWRPRYNRSFLGEMFLNFAENQQNVKRIAYAASFGMDKWDLSKRKIEKFSRLAKKFDLITVREDSGVNLCRIHLGMQAQHVLDPTMLLSKEDYIHLIEAEKEPQSAGNLFYYILDPVGAKIEKVKNIAIKYDFIPFSIMPKYPVGYRNKNEIKNNIEDCIYPSVTSWLRAFLDAEMIITDSFHGMVFSIIFNKPFWVIGNDRRGMSRFNSMLKMFHLENRLIEIDQLKTIDINESIDWEKTNQIMEMNTYKSKTLLFEAIIK